ncbi:MAG: hypothetical protein H7061_12955 [Bdellovibrionaceae bacterium]|nr:hypothetical protein [Bdellovibrio sp.]
MKILLKTFAVFAIIFLIGKRLAPIGDIAAVEKQVQAINKVIEKKSIGGTNKTSVAEFQMQMFALVKMNSGQIKERRSFSPSEQAAISEFLNSSKKQWPPQRMKSDDKKLEQLAILIANKTLEPNESLQQIKKIELWQEQVPANSEENIELENNKVAEKEVKSLSSQIKIYETNLR